jgi:hypothetical protein
MKSIVTIAVLAALILAPLPGRAQGQEKPATAKAEPAAKPAPATPRRSRANEDARACLEFATNLEIHKCSLKYL